MPALGQQDFFDFEDYYIESTSNWHQEPEMGELLPITGNVQDNYPMAYQVNCEAANICEGEQTLSRSILSEGEREYAILTSSQLGHAHSSPQMPQQIITPISTSYFKTECSNSYSCSYQTSYLPNSLNNAGTVVPRLQIIEEPSNRHRFRYESERGSHGGMTGENTKESKKTSPTVKLFDYHNATTSDIYIRASLWTDSDNPELHVHKLQHKKSANVNSPDSGVCSLRLTDDMTCVFQGVSIMFTAKKNVVDILYQREINKRDSHALVTDEVIRECKAKAETDAKKLNMNIVRILFEAIKDDQVICEVLSKPIHNQRELKITRFSRCSGYCSGGEEIYLFCEKVNKKEIIIRFFENDEHGQTIWQSKGSFSDSDVHHQVAIVFKTPKYRLQNISEPVTVLFQLFREKDQDYSDPKEFTYRPLNSDPESISRKRARIDNFDDEDNDRNRQLPYNPLVQYQFLNQNLGNPTTNFESFQNTGQNQNFGGGMQYSSPSSNNTSDESTSLSSILNSSISPVCDDFLDLQDLLNDSSLMASDSTLDRSSKVVGEMADWTPIKFSTIPLAENSNDSDVVGRMRNLNLKEEPSTIPLVENSNDSDVVGRMRNLNLKEKPSTSIVTRRQRSASLVEGRDTSALARSGAVNSLFSQLSEALRIYATTANPRALIHPLRNLLPRPNRNGDNPLHLAIIHHSSNEDLIQNLLFGVPKKVLNFTNNLYQTPLHLAVILNKPSIVQLLLMQGANPAIQDKAGNTAVHLAVLKKHIDCLGVILNKQSYGNHVINFKFADLLNYEGLAAIHLAVQMEDQNSITKLADAEADLNIGDGTSGRAALHFAVEQHPHMLDCLFKQMNLNIDCQDFSGETPLHLACHQGNEDVVFNLMQHEANPLVERFLMSDIESNSQSGLTPLDVAEENGYTVIKSILAGEVPEEEKRRIINQRKASMKESSDSIDNLNIPRSLDSGLSVKHTESNKEFNLQQTHMDSGYASAPQVEEIPEIMIDKLCQILDPPSKDWQKLVLCYLGEQHIEPIQKICPSPTRAVLDKMTKQGDFNLDYLRNILEASDLGAAREIFD